MAKPRFAVKKNRLAGFCDRLVNGAAGLVWSILSRKRRKKLADDARKAIASTRRAIVRSREVDDPLAWLPGVRR